MEMVNTFVVFIPEYSNILSLWVVFSFSSNRLCFFNVHKEFLTCAKDTFQEPIKTECCNNFT